MKKYERAGGEALAKAVEEMFKTGLDDYHLEPLNLVDEKGDGVGCVKKGDGVIFCCRRGEREVELTDAFADPDFSGFEREKIDPLDFVILTMYHEKYTYLPIAFAPSKVQKTLGEIVSKAGKTQMHLAESEKYAHVTFFFNGGVEEPNPGEDRILVPSPKVATYDMQPEMSANEVTEKVIEEIEKDKYDLIILNFANSDMVGHTGVFDAAVKAVETLDKCVKQITDAVIEKDGQILLTADHGNSDYMLDADGNVVTSHSTNPVPLVNISNDAKEFNEYGMSGEGKLADLAPTLLTLMDIDIPEEMTGKPLV